MKRDELTSEQIKAIREAFDKAIKEGPWQESNFLRVMGKRLEGIRDDFLLEVGILSGDSDQNAARFANQDGLRSGQQEIYISLYSSNGGQMSAWEKIIANLPRQLISRPIYEEEKKVIDRIKSKSIPQNEAYVCAYISKEDIKNIPEEKIPHDGLNNPLLTVKDRAITLDDITRFEHFSGTYGYEEGHLVKKVNKSSSDGSHSE